MKKKIILCILAVILLIIGICTLVSGIFGGETALEDVSTLTSSEMDGSADYKFSEAIVFDRYATYEENNIPETYYLAIGFYDANDNLCIASLAMDKNDDIYDEVMDYLNDDSMYLGDLVLPMYCTADTFSDNTEVGEYFEEYHEEIASNGISGELLWLQMNYQGATLTEYEESSSVNAVMGLIMGGGFLVLGIALLLLAILKKKPQPAPASAYAAPQASGYTAPQAPSYSAPQASGYAAPQASGYSAPQASGYSAPQAPSYSAPQTSGYGAPQASGYATPPAPAPARNVCPTCGERLKPGAAFCGNCGTRIS